MKNSIPILTFLAVTGCSHIRSASVAPKPVLTAEDIARSPALSIEQLLMARVPGLTVTTARDGHLAIHLRGTGGDEGREALFVIDGTPLGDAANFSAVNRFDIATIEVLPDAAGMAMYGMRGANGVIVVKTKGS